MDEQKHRADENEPEDLEMTEEAAEDVKGGFHWGVSQTGFADSEGPEPHLAGLKAKPGIIRGVDGGTVQHNETLVRV